MANARVDGVVGGDPRITLQELEAARQTVRLCSGLSRQELARTICEHGGWVPASGSHKGTACLAVRGQGEQKGLLRLAGKGGVTGWDNAQCRGAVPDA